MDVQCMEITEVHCDFYHLVEEHLIALAVISQRQRDQQKYTIYC